MVGVGGFMILLGLVGYAALYKGRLENNELLLKILFWSLPLPYFGNACGWFVAEAGRQPWLVYGLQTTAAGVSKSVTSTEIWISMIGFTLVYIIAAIAAVYLAKRHIKNGPEGIDAVAPESKEREATLWNS